MGVKRFASKKRRAEYDSAPTETFVGVGSGDTSAVR